MFLFVSVGCLTWYGAVGFLMIGYQQSPCNKNRLKSNKLLTQQGKKFDYSFEKLQFGNVANRSIYIYHGPFSTTEYKDHQVSIK